jgi:hypothetical protein
MMGMKQKIQWRVHTPNLLKEVLANSSAGILEKPLNILGKLLAMVGERAAELNDPELNALMLRLTIYSAADPDSPDYDQDVVDEYLKQANQ